jgi:hypothetical protein
MTVTVTDTRHKKTTHSGLTRYQLAGRETHSALVRERDAVHVLGVFHEEEAE